LNIIRLTFFSMFLFFCQNKGVSWGLFFRLCFSGSYPYNAPRVMFHSSRINR
jgi:hypothetical protein